MSRDFWNLYKNIFKMWQGEDRNHPQFVAKSTFSRGNWAVSGWVMIRFSVARVNFVKLEMENTCWRLLLYN